MASGSSVRDEFVPKTGARLSAREPGLDEAEVRSIIETTYMRAWHGQVKIKPRCFNNTLAWTAARAALIHTPKETYQ
jgi:hypothetical protein